ncbi:hypothetical protein BJ170DRAFT_626435 [Xylariales sp. AK1849]|nr:hypothetical protein BJ170DRAFT_626435 [Xylariales sp. AK1849]
MDIPTTSMADFLRQEFDYLIVGGGTAGLAVAARLSDNPQLTIGVLEAGSAKLNVDEINIPGLYGQALGTKYDWQFQTLPQEGLGGRVLPWSRGKVLGGSSALNFMTWNRGSRQDYDAWEELGNAGWGWDSLLPFFKKVENFHLPEQSSEHQHKHYYDLESLGTSGPVQISYGSQYSASHHLWHQTLESLDIETNTRHLSGSNVGAWTSVGCIDPDRHQRSYSTTAYYLPVSSRPNLFVLTEALAKEILIEQDCGKWVARGVKYTRNGETSIVHASREVVLSAGSVQSPQLLELSGVGNPGVLARGGIRVKVPNTHVGENLQDHIMTAMIFEVDPSHENPDDWKHDEQARVDALQRFRKSNKGPLAVLPMSLCYVPASQFMPTQVLNTIVSKLGLLDGLPPERSDIFRRRFDGTDKVGQAEYIFDLGNWSSYFAYDKSGGKKYGTMLQILQYPFSRGSIHIAPSNDLSSEHSSMEDIPHIDPKYYLGPHGEIDLDIMVYCARFADKICRTTPLANVIRSRVYPSPSVSTDEEWRDWIIQNTVTDWHPIGTCAMGGITRAGVVDERLRVYGVERLRVVDASIMPTQISAHLQATVYAIAEKASCMILEDLVDRRTGTV